jgi:hypothetical protein
MTILDYFHIPGNVPKLDKWKIKMMMMMMMMMMKLAAGIAAFNFTEIL